MATKKVPTKKATKKSTPKVEKKVKKEKPPVFTVVQGTVGGFVSDAHSAMGELGDEMQEAYDNAPDSLKETDVNQRRSEAADTIEGLSEPDISSSILSELDVSYQADNGKMYRGRRSQSRNCRGANVSAAMRACADAVQQWVDDNPEDDGVPEGKEYSADDFAEAHGEADEVINACNEFADEMENVDFPGMFG